MPKVDSYQMLFGEINHKPADFKISLDLNDEEQGRADFLWNKLSDRNKVGISTELDINKNLIPCTLKDNKIVLSSTGDGGSANDNVIVIESYHIIESTNNVELPDSGNDNIKLTCFPFQFATGQLRTILVQQAQNLGVNLNVVYIAIYANDKPGLNNSRLIWSSTNTDKFTNDGLLSFVGTDGKCFGPKIDGYTTVGTEKKANTFFYIVFGAQGANSGGYKILGMKNPTGFGLFSSIGNTHNIGTITVSKQATAETGFHSIFDYDIDNDLTNLIVPHISFEMIV